MVLQIYRSLAYLRGTADNTGGAGLVTAAAAAAGSTAARAAARRKRREDARIKRQSVIQIEPLSDWIERCPLPPPAPARPRLRRAFGPLARHSQFTETSCRTRVRCYMVLLEARLVVELSHIGRAYSLSGRNLSGFVPKELHAVIYIAG